MGVIIKETDSGTKKKVRVELESGRKRMKKAVRKELEAVWAKILEDAIDLCPKDTGALARSITLVEGGEMFGIAKSVGNEVISMSIVAGSDEIINPKTGKATSLYAPLVHDGHRMRDGTFWHGVPFLDDAIRNNWAELDKALARALKELDKGV